MEKRTAFWIQLVLRIVLGTLYAAAGLASFGVHFYLSNDHNIKPWLPDYYGILLFQLVGALILAVGLGLIIGFRLRFFALASAISVLGILFLFLLSDPFYDTMKHLVPFFAMSLFIYALLPNEREKNEVVFVNKKYDDLSLLLRLFIGLIFLAQGVKITFVTGPVAFAEKVYVSGFSESIIPAALLWITGVINPFILFLGGLALMVGFQTRLAALVMCGFLISIIFGHMLQDPYETTGDLTHYGINNLAFILVVLYCTSRSNQYSFDNFFDKKLE